jgi:hypothetical protein
MITARSVGKWARLGPERLVRSGPIAIWVTENHPKHHWRQALNDMPRQDHPPKETDLRLPAIQLGTTASNGPRIHPDGAHNPVRSSVAHKADVVVAAMRRRKAKA